MKLLIAIPALNEEESIEAIIQRSLDARGWICENSAVTDVQITVVSDGSTDRTVEIASRYRDAIDLIVFPENKGYGAAIKEAWRHSDADIVGFLDADGTCDPRFFAVLCARLIADDADVALGCRLNKDSRMPLIRRIGNTIFAAILTAVSSNRVRDTASGMRVVRRRALPVLFPLPDGLHFTPAMSARAMLSEKVRIVEIDMPYEERAGESKLRVVKDGLRFLGVILQVALLYRPSRLLGIASVLSFAVAFALMLGPSVYYLQHRTILPVMIYRFLVSDLFAIGGCLIICASFLADRMISIALAGELSGRRTRPITRIFQSRFFWLLPIGSALIGVTLVFSSVAERLRTGGTDESWARYVAMTFWVSAALILTMTRVMDYLLTMVADRIDYLQHRLQRDLNTIVAEPEKVSAPAPRS